MLVNNYQHKLCNNPENQRPQQNRHPQSNIKTYIQDIIGLEDAK